MDVQDKWRRIHLKEVQNVLQTTHRQKITTQTAGTVTGGWEVITR